MTFRPASLLRSADAWLTAPAPDARGRLGLYRIIYAIFYLWYLATQQSAMISLLPRFYYHNQVWLLRQFPKPPSFQMMQILESALAGLLILLLFGLKTRIVTACIVVIGTVLEGYLTMVDSEQGNILLVFFIPFFMLLAGNWGATHSVDSLLRSRSKKPSTDPKASGSEFMAARLLLVLISFQFVLSGIYKLFGTWLTHPRLLGNLMLSTSVDAAYYEMFVNPFAKLIADTPLLFHGLQWTALVFECLFFVCLFGHRLRVIVLSAALVFHSLNAFLMWVTFTNILIVYPALMNWQSFYDRHRLARLTTHLARLPNFALRAVPVALCVFIALLWNADLSPRALLTLGGLVDFQTIWIPIPLIAMYWLFTTLIRPRKPLPQN